MAAQGRAAKFPASDQLRQSARDDVRRAGRLQTFTAQFYGLCEDRQWLFDILLNSHGSLRQALILFPRPAILCHQADARPAALMKVGRDPCFPQGALKSIQGRPVWVTGTPLEVDNGSQTHVRRFRELVTAPADKGAGGPALRGRNHERPKVALFGRKIVDMDRAELHLT
ncbi:hypothetical protein [Methylobacterium sp. A54F]